MRFPLAAIGALAAVLCAVAVRAEEPVPEQAASLRQPGYAFEYPRILSQQRLFGVAHGISLLTAACRALPEFAQTAADSYVAWRTRQQPALDAADSDLSAYYFGAGPTDRQTLARTMQLRDALDYAPDSTELKAACATLPDALQRQRYDLVERFRLEELMARVVAAVAVEVLDRHCRERFADVERQIHVARHALWQEINAPALQQASAMLASAWPEDAPAATFADWLAALHRETRAGGTLADCRDFSAALKRPETALRNVFGMPPPPLPSPSPQ